MHQIEVVEMQSRRMVTRSTHIAEVRNVVRVYRRISQRYATAESGGYLVKFERRGGANLFASSVAL